MDGSRRRVRSVFLVLIVVCLAILVAGPLLTFPAYMRLFPGREHLLQVLPLFTVRNLSGPRGFLARTADGVAVRPRELGKVNLELRFMDIIPLRHLVVDVVPQVYVRPGGHAIGVLLSPEGLIVTHTLSLVGIDGREYYPAREAGILPGDIIKKIAGQPVRSIQQVSVLVDRWGRLGRSVNLVLSRGGREFQVQVRPVAVEERNSRGQPERKYMLGLVLEEPTAGVGTLTFYEPFTRQYGALGHLITDRANRPMVVDNGRIVRARINEIRRGCRGNPGEKKGFFRNEEDVIGTIKKNTRFGIFGTLFSLPGPSPWDKEVPVALATDVHTGGAVILTVLEGERIEAFDVEIIKVYPQRRPDDKGLVLRVVDERLLQKTGGVIQGMSGSPILQDGVLVGAVTHVLVNDPERGFGIFAEWMLQEAGLWNRRQQVPSASPLAS